MTALADPERLTGFRWLDTWPKQWSKAPLKHLVIGMRAGDAIAAEEIEPEGLPIPVYGANGLRGYAADFTHDGVYVLVGRQGALCGNVHLVDGRFWASEHAIVVTPDPRVEPRWLAQVMAAMDLGQYSTNAAQPGIGVTQISGLAVPVPPLEDQRQIADYLDSETARIDRLIAKQQALVETLRERRAAVADSILGGLVGVGERLKWYLSAIDRRAGDDWPTYELLSVSIDWGVRPRSEVAESESRAEDLAAYKVVEPGQIVVNRMRAFQGALGVSPVRGLASPDYLVLDTSRDVDADWLAALMRSRSFVQQMSQRVRGIGNTESGAVRTPRINLDDLFDIRVAVPDVPTQLRASETLREQTLRIDGLIARTEQFMEVSRERRAALITAAVTGQIDVRGAA